MVKREALQEIKRLFSLAEKVFDENPERAHRYVYIARRIGMKANVSIPRELRRKFCRKCLHFLKPGKNCQVRVHKHRVIYKCLDCGNVMRFVVRG